jgi:hypothetical protein
MMPFRLKNAGATFQRCMRCVFVELIGLIMEAYVDDIMVRLKKTGNLVSDLTEVSYLPELMWWTTERVRSCHLPRVPQLFR